MELSLRWAARSKGAHGDSPNALLASSRGACIRRFAGLLDGLQGLGFDGYAIGGLSVGEPKPACSGCWSSSWSKFAAAPRYLMGVGTPSDLVEGVVRGVDMFDCVMPTRNARNGHLFTHGGVVRIRNAAIAATIARSMRPAPATPARISPGPTFITWIAAEKCWGRSWGRFITSPTTWRSWRNCGGYPLRYIADPRERLYERWNLERLKRPDPWSVA